MLLFLHSDNSLTLLHYIVKTYLKMCDDPLNAALPVPEPSDVEQATSVQFDDVKQQLMTLRKDLEGSFAILYSVRSERKYAICELRPARIRLSKMPQTF